MYHVRMSNNCYTCARCVLFGIAGAAAADDVSFFS